MRFLQLGAKSAAGAASTADAAARRGGNARRATAAGGGMKQRGKRIKVLIVDDEVGIRELLSEILMDEGYAISTAANATEATERRRADTPDIILLDIWMPDLDGISLLRQWTAEGFANVPVIVMSGHATIETAVEAVRLGALEVIEKPITTTRLLGAMDKAKTRKHKQDSNLILQMTDFGASPAMTKFKKDLLAAAEEPGLITLVGALNGGAMFYARFLARPRSPVVVVDNGAMLENNIGELVRRAEDGVIIVRLASVFNPLQQNGLLGLVREVNKSEARLAVVSAEAPAALTEQGELSETLITLLSKRVVEAPSLVKCRPDLAPLIRLICAHLGHGTEMQKKRLAPQAIEALAAHHYEEDFAELMSVIRSVFLYSQSDHIEAGTVRAMLRQMQSHSSLRGMFNDVCNMPLREAREYFEREYFIRLINMTHGNMNQAARIAGLERTYFYRKLKQYKEEAGGEDDAAEDDAVAAQG